LGKSTRHSKNEQREQKTTYPKANHLAPLMLQRSLSDRRVRGKNGQNGCLITVLHNS
jgi:hypothetical protein